MGSRSVVKSLCVLLGAAGAAVLGVSCASETKSVGRAHTPAERSKAFPIQDAEWAKIGYRNDWKGYPTITGSLPVRFLEAYPDIVVTVEEGSQATILEAGTGGRRCSDQLATPITRFVGLARDASRVYGCSDAEVFALDPQTCNMVSRQKTQKVVASEPLLFGDLLIFGTGTGELLAHMTRSGVSGVKAWGFGVPGAIERRPVAIGDAVGAVSQSGS